MTNSTTVFKKEHDINNQSSQSLSTQKSQSESESEPEPSQINYSIKAERFANPHAYDQNLPFICKDDSLQRPNGGDGVPYVTQYAYDKARELVVLVQSIQLTEDSFLDIDDYGADDDDRADDDEDDDEDEMKIDDDNKHNNNNNVFSKDDNSLSTIIKKCRRVNSLLRIVSGLKYCGSISQIEYMEMLLHVLRLLSATVIIEQADSITKRKITLKFDNVGSIRQIPNVTKQQQEEEEGEEEEDKNKNNLPIPFTNQQSDKEIDLLEYLTESFALPSPARTSLLSTANSILSEKSLLSSVSNMALPHVPSASASGNSKMYHCQTDNNITNNNLQLIIEWKALLRILLRTAPHIDERYETFTKGYPPSHSHSSHSVLQGTVNVIRQSRRFFNQGLHVRNNKVTDYAAMQIWNMLKSDLIHRTYSHACYRAIVLLYLFQPTRCSTRFYMEVMPLWLDSWGTIDRCTSFDYLWLTMFCRARKFIVSSPPPTSLSSSNPSGANSSCYNWGPLRRRLLSLCGSWLQIPMTGTTDNSSFPTAQSPRQRAFPSKLKNLVGIDSPYQEGMDFVSKVSKLLLFSIGMNDNNDTNGNTDKDSSQQKISDGTRDILRFLSFVTPYFHPSSTGSWTYPLGVLLYYISFEFSQRIVFSASHNLLTKEHPILAQAVAQAEPYRNTPPVPSHEIVAIMNALLPLCQQSVYSKLGRVSEAGSSALLFLAQIDPEHVCPPFLDFATRALDSSAVHMSHQAPAALSLLTSLVQPSLRWKPSILLERLPEILRLSLAGIDGNDGDKTVRTLIFFRNLTSWIPVGTGYSGNGGSSSTFGGKKDDDQLDGTCRVGRNLAENVSQFRKSDEYLMALSSLPESSLLYQSTPLLPAKKSSEKEDNISEVNDMLHDMALAMGDWSIAFLDRIYSVLRTKGEQEKAVKRGSAGTRHSSADASFSKNNSRILKETLVQVFSAMDCDTHQRSIRSVENFFREESALPFAAKDASSLFRAVSSARVVVNPGSGGVSSCLSKNNISPGLDVFVPLLTENMRNISTKTFVYRIRCLAGAVRFAGIAVLNHRKALVSAIRLALDSTDKHVFKTGCKLLRHTLFSQCEAYPISSDSRPRISSDDTLGKSAHLHKDRVLWHVPSGEQLDFTVELICTFAWNKNLSSLCSFQTDLEILQVKSFDINANLCEWRRCLRVLRYTIRGCSGILLDANEDVEHTWLDPSERAVHSLLKSSSTNSKNILSTLRGRFITFITSIMSLIAIETTDVSAPSKLDEHTENETVNKLKRAESATATSRIARDVKICREVHSISSMLFTQRCAQFRWQETSPVLQGQKDTIIDYSIQGQKNAIASCRQRNGFCCCGDVLHFDGEDGGKTIPRRLLSGSVDSFLHYVQRNSSFEIPRRLKRQKGKLPISTLFSINVDIPVVVKTMESCFDTNTPIKQFVHPIDMYSGLLDGLFALTCHPNPLVRQGSLRVVDYALTRFGCLVGRRVTPLLNAISLQESKQENGSFGLPSCLQLSNQINVIGQKKRLAEVVKSILCITANTKMMNNMMSTENYRFALVKALCETENIIRLLPTEELERVVVCFHNIFSKFRSKYYCTAKITKEQGNVHHNCLNYLLNALSSSTTSSNNESEVVKNENSSSSSKQSIPTEEKKSDGGVDVMHWRNRLVVGWFMLTALDVTDLTNENPLFVTKIWKACFDLIKNEVGQPLQRIALGILGRLVTLYKSNLKLDASLLQTNLLQKEFCQNISTALVYDHREDASVGGGHHPQWSIGVEDMVKDATLNLSPKILFPFQRVNQSGAFKVQHAQLLHEMLVLVGRTNIELPVKHFLSIASELAASPPSEDQKNELCTSAEIFAGVCRSILLLKPEREEIASTWKEILLPWLDDAIPKIPTSVVGSYVDSVRYGIHQLSPTCFYPLTEWIIINIESSLWQQKDQNIISKENIDNESGDGFATQSKWLSLVNAILIELDLENILDSEKKPFYMSTLVRQNDDKCQVPQNNDNNKDMQQSWNLVTTHLFPRLLNALGHPYEKCRTNVAYCLFRICCCYQKHVNTTKAMNSSFFDSSSDIDKDNVSKNLGKITIERLSSIRSSNEYSFKEQYHALMTAGKFITLCIHLGDCKYEYSNFIIPLIPMAFEAIVSLVDDVSDNETSEKLIIQAEVIKRFRHNIAQISAAIIGYGVSNDISRVLTILENDCSTHEVWQVRQASAHFLRSFQGCHKFLFCHEQTHQTTKIVVKLLSDNRREVSSAAIAALTGILAATSLEAVTDMVNKYVRMARRSVIRKVKKSEKSLNLSEDELSALVVKEKDRAFRQQTSVSFLCAAVLAHPYETPPFVPQALSALSKHSFESRAPLTIRETVKMCCGEFKRTHMSDNWDLHRKQFTQEQLEALEDVISTPHYYA